MPVFKYVAKNEQSKNLTGNITAEDKSVVVEELRKRKLTVISIAEQKNVKEKGKKSHGRVKAEEIVMFSRQLATMVDAGLPILQGLNALSEQTQNVYFKQILQTVEAEIRQGNSLSSAFGKHPKVFNPLFVNLVKVGETGGVLSAVLDRVSNYMEKTLQLQRKVKSAMIYPSVVVSMAALITIGLLVKVVPTFKEIYASFDKELPAMTQVLITISDGLKQYLLFGVLGLVGAAVAIVQMKKTEKGGLLIDKYLLRLPIFGDLLRKVAISRFCRTLATLVQSGVPILESLNIVEKTIGNKVLEKVVREVQDNVRQGESLATPLERSTVFPPMVTRMISVGEKSGQLEKMLVKVSDFFDDQVDVAVEGLTSIIEPLIIGFLGIVIGFVVVALFMPILNMTQLIQ